jgi:hypothetical protein
MQEKKSRKPESNGSSIDEEIRHVTFEFNELF